MIVHETERLALRRFTEADAEHLLVLESDPEVMRHVGRPPLPDADAYRERIRTRFLPQYDLPGVFGAFAVERREDGEFVGGVGLKPAVAAPHAAAMGFAPGEVEIGLMLRRHFWGRGYASELFRALAFLAFARSGATRVVAAVSSANPASARALEKAGFRRQEGDFFMPDEAGVWWRFAAGWEDVG